MFVLHDYIIKMLRGMVGNYPDWQIMEYALNWYSKGKLTEEDLAMVEGWFVPAEEPAPKEDATEEPNDVPTEPADESLGEPVAEE